MLAMIDKAAVAFTSWSQTPVAERAALLCRIADILERHMDELIALCIKQLSPLPTTTPPINEQVGVVPL